MRRLSCILRDEHDREMTVYLSTGTVLREQTVWRLPPTQARILRKIASYPDKPPVTTRELTGCLSPKKDVSAVRVHLRCLRSNLGNTKDIEYVQQQGYRMKR